MYQDLQEDSAILTFHHISIWSSLPHLSHLPHHKSNGRPYWKYIGKPGTKDGAWYTSKGPITGVSESSLWGKRTWWCVSLHKTAQRSTCHAIQYQFHDFLSIGHNIHAVLQDSKPFDWVLVNNDRSCNFSALNKSRFKTLRWGYINTGSQGINSTYGCQPERIITGGCGVPQLKKIV